MTEGNGTGQLKITADDMGPGWVYFQVAQRSADTVTVGQWLNRAVCDWLKQHPKAKVRSSLPINEMGDTVAIHLWFDE